VEAFRRVHNEVKVQAASSQIDALKDEPHGHGIGNVGRVLQIQVDELVGRWLR
jgi:hypothetical protein